jgi:hypothetical protein
MTATDQMTVLPKGAPPAFKFLLEIEDEIVHTGMPETSQGPEQRGWTFYSDCDPDAACKRRKSLIQLHPVRQCQAAGQLPFETGALHFQSFNVQQVAAHVALNMHKSAEHVAQAGSFDVRPVQRDNAKSVEPVQHASVEGRVEYGPGRYDQWSVGVRTKLTDREIRCERAYGDRSGQSLAMQFGN